MNTRIKMMNFMNKLSSNLKNIKIMCSKNYLKNKPLFFYRNKILTKMSIL